VNQKRQPAKSIETIQEKQATLEKVKSSWCASEENGGSLFRHTGMISTTAREVDPSSFTVIPYNRVGASLRKMPYEFDNKMPGKCHVSFLLCNASGYVCREAQSFFGIAERDARFFSPSSVGRRRRRVRVAIIIIPVPM